MKKQFTKIAIMAAMVLTFSSAAQAVDSGAVFVGGSPPGIPDIGIPNPGIPAPVFIGGTAPVIPSPVIPDPGIPAPVFVGANSTTAASAILDTAIGYGAKGNLAYNIAHTVNSVNISNDQLISINGLEAPIPTPIPAAAWLLGSGLVGLVGIRRRSQK